MILYAHHQPKRQWQDVVVRYLWRVLDETNGMLAENGIRYRVTVRGRSGCKVWK